MQVQHHIEVDRNIAVKGWIFGLPQFQQVAISLWINGKKAAQKIAQEFRPDLMEIKEHPTGNCGFHFFFSDYVEHLEPVSKIQITLSSSDKILLKEQISFVTPKPKGWRKRKYFFVHIPKTAGTSFRFMLQDVFAQKHIYPNEAALFWNQGAYKSWEEFRQMPASIFDNKQLIMGHLPAVAAGQLPFKSRLITFLREPMARVFSDINYKYPLTSFLQGVDINDAIHMMRNELLNVQVRYFADVEGGSTPYFESWRNMDDQAFEQAKNTLRECAFLGITEQFEASLALARRDLSWDLGSPLSLNKTQSEVAKALSEESLHFLRNNNAYDLEFYQFALSLFEKRKKKRFTFFW